MSLEGRLDIDLYHDTCIRDVEIRSTRALNAVSLLRGKAVGEVLDTLPLLYSVCATAQSMAATAACEQALGIEVSSSQHEARQLLLGAETVREHILRILLDWPAFVDDKPGAPALAAMNRFPARLRAALYPGADPFRPGGGALAVNRHELKRCLDDVQDFIETQILALDFAAWAAIDDEAALQEWMAQSDSIAARLLARVVAEGWSDFGRCEVCALPELAPEALHACLQAQSADAFVSQPRWQGHACETSAFTRQRQHPLLAALCRDYGNGLLPRLVARLHELVVTLEQMRATAGGLGRAAGCVPARTRSGIGLAQVEAARGRLIHRVEVDGERVRRYQIVAPTEWNFHPDGLLNRALTGCRAGQALFQQAMLLVNAVDPCVDYRLRVH